MRSVTTAEWRWALLDATAVGMITQTEQHVALTLAVRMNADGTIPDDYRPGVRRIAADCARKTDTVSRALTALRDAGFLHLEQGRGSARSRYAAAVPDGYRPARSVPPTGDTTRGSDPPVGDTSVPSGGDTSRAVVSPLQAVVSPLEDHCVPPAGDEPALPALPAPPRTWEQAYSQVRAEVARVGARPGYAHARQHFDALTEATIRKLGGWRAICTLDDQRGRWEFRDAWNELRGAAA